MCGRYTLHTPLEVILQIFQIARSGAVLVPNYNVAPGQQIAIVTREAGVNALANCRWGLLPPWAASRPEGHAMINARAETVAEKPSFREAFRHGRCLVIADGFFEWRTTGKQKQPVYVRLKNGEPFGFAGISSVRTSPDGEQIRTGAIITTIANDLLRPVHDRMPVILPRERRDLWLDPAAQDADRLLALLAPYPAEELVSFDVSPRVNQASHNMPENIHPLSPH